MSAELPLFDDFCNNASFNSTQQYFWELDKPEYGVATSCFLLLYFFVGLPLNCLVAGTMLFKKLYKQQPAHVLLFSLCLSDSVMLLVLVPQGVVTGFAGEFILGQSDHQRCQVCYIGAVIVTWFALLTLFTISLMSLDRFLFIYIPLHYQRKVTPRKMTIVIVFMWIFCSILSILPVLDFGHIDFTREYSSCTVNVFAENRLYFVTLLIAAILPLAILVICNVWVVVIVLKTIRTIYSSPNNYQSRNKEAKKIMRQTRHKKQLHLMQVFGSLLVVSLVSWLPVIVITTLAASASYSDIPTVILILPYYLMLSQVVVHPVLEVTLISAIKEPIKDMFKTIIIQTKERLCCPCAKTHCLNILKCANREEEEEEEKDEDESVYCNCLSVLCIALIPKEFHTTAAE